MLEETRLPEFFISMLVNQYGEKVSNQIIQGYEKKRFTTLRANTLKANTLEIEKELEKANIEYEKVQWYEDAFMIKNADEREIQKLSIYEQGKIYLQSLSSMLPPLILNPNSRSRHFRHGSCTTVEKQQSLQHFPTMRLILQLVK